MLALRIGSGSVYSYLDDMSQLRAHGILCEKASTGQEASQYLRLYDYDVVLLDQPVKDGRYHEIVRQIRLDGSVVPIVVLADTATSQVKALSLNQGADEFITMPCAAEELFARIRAVVRRSRGHATSVIRVGAAEFRPDRREVRVGENALSLSRREFMVLELLFLKNGSVVTKTALFNHLYCGQDEREMKTLDVITSRLRKKLVAAGMPPLIDTVWGMGYTLRVPERSAGAPIVGVQVVRNEPVATFA